MTPTAHNKNADTKKTYRAGTSTHNPPTHSHCARRQSARLLAPVLAVCACLWAGAATARPAVVELFTSQGCSSCPPADALLNTIADREDVIALSYNVTYWDYLGWRDTLGREEHTARQEAYAEYFQDRKYTPQLVIDGETHMPGSRTRASRAAIEDKVRKVQPTADLATETTTDGVRISAPAREIPSSRSHATVWLVQYDRRKQVEITRGENAGENITYANVVREITPLDNWDMSKPLTLDVARDMLLKGAHDGCAIIIQASGDGSSPVYGVGRVIAATRIDMAALN